MLSCLPRPARLDIPAKQFTSVQERDEGEGANASLSPRLTYAYKYYCIVIVQPVERRIMVQT